MITVTVCDDEAEVIESFKGFAARFQEESGEKLDWNYISSTQRMEPELLAGEDILILDIQMGEINGIDLARKIRLHNDQNIIIFSTNYLEYALQGYEVAAFRYLKKPIGYGQFAAVLSEALRQYRKSARSAIALRCGHETEQVRIAEVVFCETRGSHLRVCLSDGTELLANTGISALEKELADYGFFRCHKGCLVNLHYVKRPMKTDVLMKNGEVVPVSRHRMKEFMVALMHHWGGQLR